MKNLAFKAFVISMTVLFINNSSVLAQQAMTISRVDGVVFDGNPFDEQWQKVEPLPMTVFTPVYQGDPTERTDIRVGYDDKYLYVAGRCYDSNPKGIQGNSLVRDHNAGGDFLNVLIDSFNDNETFWYFGIMPSGMRIDAEIAQDAETDAIFNPDWNTFWDAKTVEADSGWFAEIRIPFSSLRFKVNAGEVEFGFSTNRMIGRKAERHVYPNIAPNWAAAVWKASQAAKVKITDIKAPKPLYFSPYLLTGFSRQNEVNTDPPVTTTDDWKKEVGGDLKIGLSSNFTLDLTANTDFAQVEVDNFQSNLTRFSLFFPEKRQFFQERAGIFNFQLSGFNRLFHSRLIGLTPDGRPERVYGGARLIGRTKGLDLGVLDMQTDAVDSVGSINFGVVRVRQRVFNLNSYVGGIFTSKVDEHNNYNVTYGLDALIRTHGQNFLTVKGGQSVRNGVDKDNYFLYGKWEKRAFQGLGYSVEVDKTANGFDPGIGFILRHNLLLGQAVSYGFLLESDKVIRSLTPYVSNTLYLRNSDGDVETQATEAGLNSTLLNGSSLGIYYRRTYDEVNEAFQFSDKAQVNPGDYTYHTAGLSFQTNSNNKYILITSAEAGQYYDGNRLGFTINPVLIFSKHFEVNAAYTYDRLKFNDRQQTARADIGSLNALVAFDLHWSVSSLVQYNRLTDKFGVNARLRYNPKEGNDFFIVFNHLTDYDPAYNENGDPLVENWSILLKYTRAFNLNR